MKNLTKTSFLSVILMMVLTGCATITGFEEGRALGKNNVEILLSASYVQSPTLNSSDQPGNNTPRHNTYPLAEVNIKMGVTNKLDIGGKLNTNANFSGFFKYQMIGDQTSRFALGSGVELSTFSGLEYAIQVPVYMTYYFSESLALNVSPRGVYSVGSEKIDGNKTLLTNDNEYTFLGGNIGILYGKKIKYGIDVGIYNVNSKDYFLIAGAGVKMKF
jgi:hypothetical protein